MTVTLIFVAAYAGAYFLFGSSFDIPTGNCFAVLLVWVIGHVGGFLAVQVRREPGIDRAHWPMWQHACMDVGGWEENPALSSLPVGACMGHGCWGFPFLRGSVMHACMHGETSGTWATWPALICPDTSSSSSST